MRLLRLLLFLTTVLISVFAQPIVSQVQLSPTYPPQDVTVVSYDLFSLTPVEEIDIFLDNQLLVKNVPFEPTAYRQFAQVTFPANGFGANNVLTIKATDVLLQTGSATSQGFSFYGPFPLLSVQSPLPYTLANPTLHIEASAQNCLSISCTITDNFGVRSKSAFTNLSFDAAISGTGTVTIIARGPTNPPVYGQNPLSVRTIPVFGTTNGNFYPELSVPGLLLDFDDRRLLYESNATVQISYRSENRLIQAPSLPYGSKILAGFLTPFGAIYHVSMPDVLNRVFELDASGVTIVSNAELLKKRGNWAVYVTPGSACFIRNLVTRVSNLTAENVASLYADVSEAGDVAYWQGVGQTNGSIYLNNLRLDDGSFPVTDGNRTVYVKAKYQSSNTGPNYFDLFYALFLSDSSGVHQLTPFSSGYYNEIYPNNKPDSPLPGIHYQIENTWIAFDDNRGISVRSPRGEITSAATILGFERPRILGISNQGDVVWKTSSFSSIPNLDFVGRWIYQSNRWEIIGGTALFSLFGPVVRARLENGTIVISSGSSMTLYSKTNALAPWQSLGALPPATNGQSNFEFKTTAEGALRIFGLGR